MSKTSRRPSPISNRNNPTCDNSMWLGSALYIDSDGALQPDPVNYDVVGQHLGARVDL